jgi:hypothetical protein
MNVFLFAHFYATSPAHFAFGDIITLIILARVKIMENLIIQVYPASRYFLPIFLSTIFSNIIKLCPALMSETKFDIHVEEQDN